MTVWSWLETKVRRFAGDPNAGVGIAFAVALPALASAGMFAVDMSKIYQQRSILQAAADSAAIASATELRIASADSRRVAGVAIAYVASKLSMDAPPIQPTTAYSTPTKAGDSGPQTTSATLSGNGDSVLVTTTYDSSNATVEVRVKEAVSTYMAGILSQTMTQIEVASTARMMGASPLCMVALDEASKDTLRLEKSSRVTGNGCAVYSNSSSPSGLAVDASSSLMASRICSVTTPGGKVNSTPAPIACPALKPDPLSYRKALFATCPLTLPPLVILGSMTVVLPPGLYCGGIVVKDNATVILSGTSGAPGGIYVMGGDLVVKDKATLKMLDSGAGAAFYFTGQKSRFDFDDEAQVSLVAPRTGELAGFLFFEDPGRADAGQAPLTYEITSKSVSQLLGTVYLKNGILKIDLDTKGPGALADKSAFTVVVTRRVQLKDGPNLVLNSNYAGSSVPVPQGVGPTGGVIAMTK
ncbi:hypothetical protein GCM10007036_38360 [Alsobacter metallidurans]|uniref:Putative Flp pilus-assembly TadG-like N-terminal domain-containing protein n=1 Tax=Alsobacter metallidurans TaxID=340221 RepID=A0A917IB94_9HYPH|nr:pilus assembly protein TadG-related protein [Alsobacter metallidurans]GGH28862.1 hypothetical protein GCM10007036_38360 [Alsobacter metallidurans]